jgi:SAM-dependent methyltransferase
VRYAWLDQAFGLGQNALQNEASRRPALEREAGLLLRHLAGGRLLDIGCDTGMLFEWFGSPAWERYGVEISPSAAVHAAQTYQAQVFSGTIAEAKYPDAYFDLVTMIDMLYYVDDPNADFEEVRRVLKPGGLLAIELAGQRYQLTRSRGLLCWLIERRWTRLQTDSAYLYWFSPGALARLLQRHGFEVIALPIITSPTQRGQLFQALTDIYFKTATWFASRSTRALTWAPKYLCLARLLA